MTFEMAAQPNPADLARETLGRDVLNALLMELKTQPKAYAQLSTYEQDQTIQRLKALAEGLVNNALRIVLCGTYPACGALLASVAFGDGIRATLKIDKLSPSRHELSDATGQTVVVVIGNADQYMQRMDEIRAAAAQGELLLQTPPAASDTSEPDDTIESADQIDHTSVSESETEPSVDAEDIARLLGDLGFDHTAAEVSQWSENQREAVTEWATTKAQYPMTTLPRPWVLREPIKETAE